MFRTITNERHEENVRKLGLCFHLFDNKSSSSGDGSFTKQRVLPECNYQNHFPTWSSSGYSEWQWDKLRWNNGLKQLASLWRNEDFQEKVHQGQIVSKLNPAAAPHFGVSWKRMVRTCKQAMYHVLNVQRLTDEILATILCLIRQLLNSRPISPNSNIPNTLEVLAPHHFLLGWPSVAISYLPDARNYQNHSKMYRVGNIWARWSKEYLPVLNLRRKLYNGCSPF